MNHQQDVQFAVMCLEALADAGKPLSTCEISRRGSVPLVECRRIVPHLTAAGITQLADSDKVVLARPIEEVTAVEILEAIWQHRDSQPAFQMWFGGQQGLRFQQTWSWVNHMQLQTDGYEING